MNCSTGKPEKIQFGSLSTWLLIFSGTLALLALVNIIPWHFIINPSDSGKHSSLEWIRLGLGLGSPFWVALIYKIIKTFQQHQLDVQLKLYDRLMPKEEFYPGFDYSSLQKKIPIIERVEIRVSGGDNIINDSGKKTLTSPLSLKFENPERLIIGFSALFRQRFRQDPQAFSAVLVHELAHFQNRDADWLNGIKRLLLAVIAIIAMTWILDMYISIASDTTSGWDWQALQASLAGKNFIVTQLVLVAALSAYVRWITKWREALADRIAITVCGETALQSAEKIIQGDDAKAERPSPGERQQALNLTWREILLLGFTVNAASEYGAGPFSYLSRFFLQESSLSHYLEHIAPALMNLLGFLGFFAVLRIISLNAGKSAPKNIPIAANILIVGAVIGHMLLQILPLLVTSVAMPEGYDYAYFHDPVKVVLGGLINESLSVSFTVLLAAFGALIHIYRQSIWIGIAPGILFVFSTTIESTFFPEVAEGWISLGVMILFVFLTLRPKLRLKFGYVGPMSNWMPMIILSSLMWLGYGDVNHLAACSSQAAVRLADKGEMTAAILTAQRAAKRAPFMADGWMHLAAMFAHTPERLDEAINASERAVNTPFTSAWETQFKTRILAGDLRLQRRHSDDIEQALKHYAFAENLWYHNSRLPRKFAASLLYNEACALLLAKEDPKEAVIRLLEAIALNPNLAQSIASDPDLTGLHLANQAAPKPSTVALLLESKNASAPAVRDTAQKWGIEDEELLRFLANMVSQRGSHLHKTMSK
ncbi:MAG: hypothetical protein D3911_07060 [Candidatus Electrothrix sp. AW3_4]|nr:hypothetical protein [Candidatus Electrothrix gigas]